MWEPSIRTIPKLRLALGSEARSLGYRKFSGAADAPPGRYSMIQLEYVASLLLLHCIFEELGGHLEEVPYAYAIWGVQL